ncbi:MAG: HAMP domain-containing protein [Elusimicrobia bacterium]|nr:HAMP domain-containing protein [Elusimicrobiota bacterium]
MRSLREIEFLLIGTLIGAVTLEGLIVGKILERIISLSKQWQARPQLVLDFFLIFGLLLLIVVGINFMIGLYISRKITRPLQGLIAALEEIKKGRLTVTVASKPADFLGELVTQFNQSIHSVFHVINRDHEFVGQAREILANCRKTLAGQEALTGKEREEIEKQIFKAEGLISFVNEHFLLKKED